MSIQWSEKQQAVIDARGCSVLVSAAAGSGKTAVLVERLIRLLTDEKHPVDIERLLVVTFTNAAAAEMRERIGRGLDQKLLEEPDHTAWIRQKLLLPCAQISTIHSLCLKTIREHFEVLDLDPSFRLGDEAELKLLKSDVAEDVMETYYASENRAFRAFVDRYANGKTDQGIAEMIIALYDADFKSEIEGLRDGYFVHTFEELKAELTYIRPSVRMLIELTEVFGQQFMAVKNDRNMLDFSDLEHYMLQLLADFSEDEQVQMQV